MKEVVQKALGVMVSAIMTLDRVFSPVLVEPNVKLDTDGYVNMVVNQHLPAILANSADLKNNYIWQQDNAPSHVSKKVHEHFDLHHGRGRDHGVPTELTRSQSIGLLALGRVATQD